MTTNKDTSKETEAQQPTDEGLDDAICSALQLCAERIAGHIQKPMDIHAIVVEIESDEYNAELMLQHLILWAAKTERHLKDPHCVRAMALLGEIVLPNVEAHLTAEKGAENEK
jgi:hypothetical protein